MDQTLVDWLRRAHSLRIGLATAEQLRINLAGAVPDGHDRADEVRGLDMANGLPRRMTVTSAQLRAALNEPLERILETIRATLDACSPDLVCDLVDRGMMLCGGGALLRGLDQWLTERTGIPAKVAADPMTAVVQGTLVCLEHIDAWESLLETNDEVI
jgi:rod shape-determining protein MreB